MKKDAKLAALKATADDTEAQWRQRWSRMTSKVKKGSARSVSILNGLVGDLLVEKGVPIAVQMAFYFNHQRLELSREGLTKAYPNASGKLCIMVHGLSCTESIWDMSDDPHSSYATRLADELGYTPMYIRYNTGLHISHNGQMLSQLMTTLREIYPHDIKEIVFICHSMGGLVTRSACFYGSLEKDPWTAKVRQLYFLGSPHMGADLEKFGNVVANVLKTAPLPYTRFVGEIIDRRSAGIKDLRYGYVRDEDWQDQDPDALLNNNKNPVPLLAGADHFVISGTVFKDHQKVLNEFFGDALVRKYSATGQSNDDKHHLPFLPQHQKEFANINHVKLAHSEAVYQQIRQWIA